MKNRELLIADKIKLSQLSGTEKLRFIWDYYKWPILISLFVVISVIATVIAVSNSKEYVLSGYLFDSFYTTDHDEPFDDFLSYAGVDEDTAQAEFLTNLTLYGLHTETAQQLFSTIAAGQTDFVVSNPETFLRLSYDSFKYFTDLRTILTEEQLEKLSDRLFYVDASMLDKLQGQTGTITLPDHDKPQNMKDPVPVGIDIRGCRGVDVLYLGDDSVFFAIVSNAPNIDMTKMFLSYLFSEIE